MSKFTLHQGDCIEVMRGMADASVDSIVTDPPYELGFMGKAWDATGIANNPVMWAEALRVLKPGGHLLAFSGSRTYHRMTCAIEDAGFDIRDQIMWIYGSGFPKSMDVSKAIDKAGATSTAWFGAWLKQWRDARGLTQKELCERCGFFGAVNRGGTIANWETGAGAPTVEQFNRICEVLSLPFASIDEARREVIGTRQAHPGVAFSSKGLSELIITAPATDAARQWDGWGTALKPAHEPICVARKPLIGTVAANVLAHGTGALNIDGCRVGTDGGTSRGENGSNAGKQRNVLHGGNFGIEQLDAGRWPANIIHDGSAEVVALFPVSTSGAMKSGTKRAAQDGPGSVCYGTYGGNISSAEIEASTGSAARFFYCAKASRADRNAGLVSAAAPAVETDATMRDCEIADWEKRNGNHHPTVKPTDLMAYLVRLVTPPGGLVLDPFMGSGSTGKACMREGFRFTGIDLGAEYVEIARARIEAELAIPVQMGMFA